MALILALRNLIYRKLFFFLMCHIFTEKQLGQKTMEISRLRSEILALEDRTPPHYQDKNFRETQNILRVKVEGLEQIIAQCDKENEELRDQREADRAQVNIYMCLFWLFIRDGLVFYVTLEQ